jgi:hypothetical protein
MSADKGNGMESTMNTRRVRLGLLSNCGRLASRFSRSCKSYILNEKADQEWRQLAWMEAAAELKAQQSPEARQRIVKRNR